MTLWSRFEIQTARHCLPAAGLQFSAVLSQPSRHLTAFNISHCTRHPAPQSYLSTPLAATSSDTAISASGALHVASILAAYNDRNVTTVLESNYPVWQPSNGNQFVLDVRVRVPDNQPILYRWGGGDSVDSTAVACAEPGRASYLRAVEYICCLSSVWP